MLNRLKILAISTVCLGSVMLTSCSTMFGNNTRQVAVNSEPSGAQVMVNGISMGTTPMTVSLPTYIYSNQLITVKKPGYQDTSVYVNAQFQMVGLLNLFNGIGFIIDVADGNAVKVNPSQLNINTTLAKTA